MNRKSFLATSSKLTALSMFGGNLFLDSMQGTSLVQKEPLNFSHSSISALPLTYSNVSVNVKLAGKDVKVHGICTGTVAVKTNFLTKNGLGEVAKINISPRSSLHPISAYMGLGD